MADDNKDKFNIRLHVYDEEINVTINREEEELYRSAAKMITDRYNVYAKLFKGRKGDHNISANIRETILRHTKMFSVNFLLKSMRS